MSEKVFIFIRHVSKYLHLFRLEKTEENNLISEDYCEEDGSQLSFVPGCERTR